jgi:hypothetical protein
MSRCDERLKVRVEESTCLTCTGLHDKTKMRRRNSLFASKKQEPAVRRSRVHPTELACFQELLKRLQDRHVDCAEAVAKKAAADAVSAATWNPDAPILVAQHLRATFCTNEWLM